MIKLGLIYALFLGVGHTVNKTYTLSLKPCHSRLFMPQSPELVNITLDGKRDLTGIIMVKGLDNREIILDFKGRLDLIT